MTTMDDQRREQWIRTLDNIRDMISVFEADYERSKPKPEDTLVRGRRLQHLYRYRADADARSWHLCTVDPEAHAELDAMLYRKRERWLELWNTCADVIAAFEAERVRLVPDDPSQAAFAAGMLHGRLAELLQTVQVEHPDMPDVELRPDDTGKYRAALSAVDILEGWYYGLFQSKGCHVDRAKNASHRRRRILAGLQFRDWLDYRASDDYREDAPQG